MLENSFHIQNIYDALNSEGVGVNGHLKLKCMQLQNRVLAMVNSEDIAAISADCPEAFCQYIIKLKGIKNITLLRFRVDEDLRAYFNSSILFSEIEKNQSTQSIKNQHPLLAPYMHSASFYKAAEQHKWHIRDQIWQSAVTEEIVELMNDKAVLYEECEKANIPIPTYWIVDRRNLVSETVRLLDKHDSLFIRQARSGGGLGNTAIRKVRDEYIMEEVSTESLSLSDLQNYLGLFVRTSHSRQFLISELLDLYASPGTLFYVTETETHIIAHTYQILNSRRIFTGFTYPILNKQISKHFPRIEAFVHDLTEFWRKKGFRGYGNIDWMITTNNQLFIAERNARQTAVVAPLTLLSNLGENSKNQHHNKPLQIPKDTTVFTKDTVHLSKPQSFESVISTLEKANLLLTQANNEGIVITIPPSPKFGASQLGIMAVGHSTPKALSIFNQTIKILEKESENLLFPYHWE